MTRTVRSVKNRYARLVAFVIIITAASCFTYFQRLKTGSASLMPPRRSVKCHRSVVSLTASAGSVWCLRRSLVFLFLTWCGLALSDQEGALRVPGGQQLPHGIVSGEILKKPAGTRTTTGTTKYKHAIVHGTEGRS